MIEENRGENDDHHFLFKNKNDINIILRNIMPHDETNDKLKNCPNCGIEYSRDRNILMDSPDNSGLAGYCKHYLCNECWENRCIEYLSNCPICGKDVSAWLYGTYPLRNSDDEDNEGEESDNEDEDNENDDDEGNEEGNENDEEVPEEENNNN